MRNLAKRIGVSATAIYHYFPSKEAILGQVRLRAAKALNDRIRAIDQGLSPSDFLNALGREYVVFAERNPNLYRLLFEAPLDDDAKVKSNHPVMYYTYLAARDALERMAKAGEHPPETRYHAMMGWIMLHGFCSLMMSGILPPAEGMSRKTLRELFFNFYAHENMEKREDK